MNTIERQRYHRLIGQLRVPEPRRTPTPTNFRWLLANAWIDNRQNPKLQELLRLIRPYA
jgi:hypothetical protein